MAVAGIILVWALLALPNLQVRSFIWEEGTNADIARDVLTNGRFLEPVIYGTRWAEKPSLLPWLIAAVAALTGRVDEWSARLPSMLAVLGTTLLVHALARRYTSRTASLFAAAAFLLSPLILQKLTVAEPDTVVTALSFGAFVLWCNAAETGPVPLGRWLGCGVLLAVMAMAKGPQPTVFFASGIGFWLIVRRRWDELSGLVLCLALPAAATAVWATAVYRQGDEATWLGYMRLSGAPALSDYFAERLHLVGSLVLEMMPATLLLPFVPFPALRASPGPAEPQVLMPLIAYSCLGTLALLVWPGALARYAMPAAPAVAVLAGIAWDRIARTRRSPLNLAAAATAGALCVYRIVLVVLVMPLYADSFGATRSDGRALDQTIRADPAPAFCTGLDTNQLFYVSTPVHCLGPDALQSLPLPAWLLTSRPQLNALALLRPDLEFKIAIETHSGAALVAARVSR